MAARAACGRGRLGGEQGAVGEDEADAGVGEHEVPAVGRVVGIEGQVSRAGLEGGEQGDDLVERAGDGDADEGLAANPRRGRRRGR